MLAVVQVLPFCRGVVRDVSLPFFARVMRGVMRTCIAGRASHIHNRSVVMEDDRWVPFDR